MDYASMAKGNEDLAICTSPRHVFKNALIGCHLFGPAIAHFTDLITGNRFEEKNLYFSIPERSDVNCR